MVELTTTVARLARVATLLIALSIFAACGGGDGPSPAAEDLTAPVNPAMPAAEDPAACAARVRANGLGGFHIARSCGPLAVVPGGRKVVSREGSLPYVVSTDRDPYPAGSNWNLYLGQALAPVMEVGSRLHIGADVAPPADALAPSGTMGGVALSKGDVRDGAGATEALAYLRTMVNANLEPDIVGLQTWPWRPRLAVVGDADARFVQLARDAAKIVNAALPFGKRINIDYLDADYSDEEIASSLPVHKHGYIYLRVRPKTDPWWSGAAEDELGRARVSKYTLDNAEKGRKEVTNDGALWSDVVLDPEALTSFPDVEVTHVIVHELLHAMGFMSHTDDTQFRSTLSEVYVRGSQPRGLMTARACWRPMRASSPARCRRRWTSRAWGPGPTPRRIFGALSISAAESLPSG